MRTVGDEVEELNGTELSSVEVLRIDTRGDSVRIAANGTGQRVPNVEVVEVGREGNRPSAREVRSQVVIDQGVAVAGRPAGIRRFAAELTRRLQ